MSVRINPLGTAAAEILGLDCSQPFSDQMFQIVESAFLDYPVLVFRDQILSATDVARFGRRFGQLEGYGNPAPTTGNKAEAPKPQLAALREIDGRETPDLRLYVSPENADVLIMSNEIRSDLNAIGIVDNAETWHSDASHRAQPCKAIILYAIRNPSVGGDTEFCDMGAVYNSLTAALKAELTGRTASHHWSKSKNPRFAGALDAAARQEGERIASLVPEMRQPVVRAHPQTGRPALYVSPRFTLRIEGVSQERSEMLLAEIFALAEETRFRYRHEWRNNDLVIWDNRCLNHRVRFFPTHDVRRRLRVSIAGDQPFYAPALLTRTPGMARTDRLEDGRGPAQRLGSPGLIAAA
jgi:taurine dioxygenase